MNKEHSPDQALSIALLDQGLTNSRKSIYISPMQPVSWDCEQEGELTAAKMKQKLESMGYSVASYTYPPGTCFPPHTHNVDKIDGVLSGRFRMSMGGESVTLRPGDMLAVPRGELHSAEVVGDEPVLSLDAVRP